MEEENALYRRHKSTLKAAETSPRTNLKSDIVLIKSKKPKRNHMPIYFVLVIFLILILYRNAIRAYLRSIRSNLCRPIALPPVFESNHTSPKCTPDLFWGTYRSAMFRPSFNAVNFVLYFIEHNGIKKFGWISHDGRTFGIQSIKDEGFTVITEWLKVAGGEHGGDWTARIKVIADPNKDEKQNHLVSLIFYFSYDDPWIRSVKYSDDGHTISSIYGFTSELGNFKILIKAANIKSNRISFASSNEKFYFGYPILKSLVYDDNNNILRLSNRMDPRQSTSFAIQLNCMAFPCGLEIAFESASYLDRPRTLIGKAFDSVLKQKFHEFNDRFDNVFTLKNISQSEKSFARALLSNLLGGIGYFYGKILVTDDNKAPQYYWPAGLFTAVPSRTFFPRGFLWDEAFHNLLIARWDLNLSLEIFGHYLDLMNADGWIPRELILGEEALMKVPAEFVVQHATHANPPAWFLTLSYYDVSKNIPFFRKIYPRLDRWFKWFNVIQKGKIDGTYRWRGRHSGPTVSELNPKTFASGFDDYPRASHPTDEERHVDLLCWMAMSAKSLNTLSKTLNITNTQVSELEKSLNDEEKLNQLHWSGYAYSDWGFHTDDVSLRKIITADSSTEYERILTGVPPKYQLISHIGYVSLFPFLMKILSPNSTQLHSILLQIRSTETLWSNYGLRSLAKNSTFYNKKNTKNDPPYWRGAIWIHMNFLALRALKFYGSAVEGPYKALANEIYEELRTNVLKNVFQRYVDTGYVWEQYNDANGKGQFSHPFTGWTSLTLLIMSEQYET